MVPTSLLFSLVVLFFYPRKMKSTYTVIWLQEDDEKTIEEDEILITEEERREELVALQAEVDLPLEELLKKYTSVKGDFQYGTLVCFSIMNFITYFGSPSP